VSSRVAKRDQQRNRLELENELQRPAIEGDHALEGALRGSVDANPAALWADAARCAALIIGVSVSETTAETMIVTARVTANSRNSRPTTSPMNNSGISTAMRETVSDRMVKPICSAPLKRRFHGRVAHFDVGARCSRSLRWHRSTTKPVENGQCHISDIVIQTITKDVHRCEGSH